MPTPKNVMRFCASSLITVACWAVWLVLGASLILLVFIASAKELAVPDFLLRRVESRLAESGFALQFGHARLDPTGKVLLEEVQLRTKQYSDPLLTCRFLYARHSFWSILSGRMEPDEIRLEGASLLLPAPLSPSGTAEPVIRDLAATVSHEGRVWQVVQAAGRVGKLTLTVHGPIAPPPRQTGAPSIPLEDWATRFLRIARNAAPQLQRLEAFTDPALAVELGPERVELLFTAHSARNPWNQPLQLGAVVAATSLSISSAPSQRTVVDAVLENVEMPDRFRAEHLHATLEVDLDPTQFQAKARTLQLTAGTVDAAEERVVAPGVRAELTEWPTVQVALLAEVSGEALAARIDAGLREKTAHVSAEGRVSHELISRVLTKATPRAAPYFVFGDPVSFRANATLGPDWKFESLLTHVDAGRIDSRGVLIRSARGRVDIHGADFLAHDARLVIGESAATGSYWMNFLSTDYRMLLDGRLRPVDISGWFRGNWWMDFWNRFFEFPGAPPAADVDIQGRWKEPSLSNNFVRAQAGPVKFLGGDFEQLNTMVYVRPNYAHGWNLEARRASGVEHLSGWFKRFSDADQATPDRLEFDFAGNPDPQVLGRVLGPRATEVLNTFRFTRPPDLHAWGALTGDTAAYRFTGDARAPLQYYGFALDSVKVTGSVDGADVQLSDIAVAAVGGQGKGRASLTGSEKDRRLGFELYFNGANLGRAVHAFEEFDAKRDGRPLATNKDSEFLRRAAGSKLDLGLSAQGNPDVVSSFRGSGNASLTGAELGEVHLFGLLSQVLSGLSLNFSSLKLDAARTSFELKDGAAYFPDLKVTGPTAVIDAKGRYILATNALDFSAKFKPYDQPGSLMTAALSLVINPLTSMLELKLSGPLADPKWSIDVTSPSSSPKAPAAVSPPGVEPAAGKPPAG